MNKDGLTIVLLGATGDLAQRKILPALIHLHRRGLLPEEINLVGFSRKDFSDSDYKEFSENAIKKHTEGYSSEDINHFLKHITYFQGDINDIKSYKELDEYLRTIENCENCFNKLFYLAIPPNLYKNVFENLSKSNIVVPNKSEGEKWRRILVEKPFGSNLNEAKILDKTLGSLFDESQIFRIDHYLAKETIQNILSFRFANAIFEPLWNRDYIDYVKIVLYEKNDLSERISYYDEIGALRDVGQNHLLQMLALILMDDPESISSENIRSARLKALSKLVLPGKDISKYSFRAQYDGYLKSDGSTKSKTETFFRLTLNSKDKRWIGVPLYLESGKGLDKDLIEIEVSFKDKESFVCQNASICNYNNTLRINVRPRENIEIEFYSKKPGLSMELQKQKLSFGYGSEDPILPEAYEKVLYDCIQGDQTLFNSTEEVATEWRIISEVLKKWQDIPLAKYEIGSKPEDIK